MILLYWEKNNILLFLANGVPTKARPRLPGFRVDYNLPTQVNAGIEWVICLPHTGSCDTSMHAPHHLIWPGVDSIAQPFFSICACLHLSIRLCVVQHLTQEIIDRRDQMYLQSPMREILYYTDPLGCGTKWHQLTGMIVHTEARGQKHIRTSVPKPPCEVFWPQITATGLAFYTTDAIDEKLNTDDFFLIFVVNRWVLPTYSIVQPQWHSWYEVPIMSINCGKGTITFIK